MTCLLVGDEEQGRVIFSATAAGSAVKGCRLWFVKRSKSFLIMSAPRCYFLSEGPAESAERHTVTERDRSVKGVFRMCWHFQKRKKTFLSRSDAQDFLRILVKKNQLDPRTIDRFFCL